MNDDLLKSLLNKVVNVLNGGTDVKSSSSDNYIAWCSPGIPFQKEDLLFATKGINGQDSEETNLLIRTAAEFSRLVNSIPSSNVIGGTYEQAGKLLWDEYSEVLRFSAVPPDELTDAEREKVEELRKILVSTRTVTDIITDEKKVIETDSPKYAAYKEKMAAYESAVLLYNSKRLNALNGETKRDVQDFALNETLYRNTVKAAMNDWASNGYKEYIENISAYIRHVSQRSMTLLKQELQDRLEKGKMTDPTTGGDFYMTGFYPGNFIASDKGWTQFSFSSKSKDTYLKEAHSETSASTKINWGLWKADADGKHSSDSLNKKMETSDFEMQFKLTQIPLGRAWFASDFLTNEAWDWKDPTAHKALSDGKNPPNGSLISYPTTAIFIKDVTIKSSVMKDISDEISKATSGGGSVGWGPFSLSARHSQQSKEINTHFDTATNTLTIEGMQLFAFKCFALPKTPDCKKKELV